jgi:SAM-dependent methyltransferase
VREQYGQAVRVEQGEKPTLKGTDPIIRDLYAAEETASVPLDAVAASFGCGNPVALAKLAPGQIVLDLGSGGGIDVLLSAKRVGPTGKAYGLDMTPEMLALARKNQLESGILNAEFLEGTLEAIPLPDASIDVVISNCVVNLSEDKDLVLREAYRVLKPGGLFAVSDIVLRRELSPQVRKSISMWTACIAGALLATEYVNKLTKAGFRSASIEPTRIYTREDAQELVTETSCCSEDAQHQMASLDGAMMSAFVRAVKP